MSPIASPTAPPLVYLCAADVARCLDPAAAMAELRAGFLALSRGEVLTPPRPKVEVPKKGFSLAMLAAMPGRRIALKAVNVFEGNHALGLPSHHALICLFEPQTGLPVAIMDGAKITGFRTAAAAMLSIELAARSEARVATVVGTGVQAHEHLRLLTTMPSISAVWVAGRRAEALSPLLATVPKARAAQSLEAAVREADIVCLTTSSPTAVIAADWIKPGTHVTSVGFAPPGSELPAELIARAKIVVETRNAFSPPPVGCAELQGHDASEAVELGEALAGTRQARASADDITLYKSMGNAMEDLVVANLVYETALVSGVGVTLER